MYARWSTLVLVLSLLVPLGGCPAPLALDDRIIDDDDSGSNDDAYLEVSLPTTGIYTIIATSANPGETGSYMLNLW